MDSFEKIHQFENMPEGKIYCICGESGIGKSYLTSKLRTDNTIILDGDAVRYYVNNDLGFTEEDRNENNIRIAKIALLLAKQGHDIIISTVKANIAYDYLKEKIKFIRLCYIS